MHFIFIQKERRKYSYGYDCGNFETQTKDRL